MKVIDLYYHVRGHGNPLVFIHGGGTDSRIWDSLVGQLSTNQQLITYDIRGHGKSPEPINPTNHVEDLYHLLKNLGLRKVTLIGHSLGGQIATDFSLLYQDKVSQLILIAPGLTGFRYDHSFQEMSQKLWQTVPEVDAMLEIMFNTPKAYAMQEALQSPYADRIRDVHRDNIIKSLRWKNFEQQWPFANSGKRLSNLKMPVLFILGDQDKEDLFHIKAHYRSVHNITFQVIKGADHGIVFTHYKQLAEAMQTFLSKTKGGLQGNSV